MECTWIDSYLEARLFQEKRIIMEYAPVHAKNLPGMKESFSVVKK